MTDLLPPPPPDTTVAWVEEINGAIVAARICPIAVASLQEQIPGASLVPITVAQREVIVSSMRAWCVVDGEVVAREASPITLSTTEIDANGVDEAVIGDIPVGTKVRIVGAVSVPWTTINSGSVTITCSVPGSIRVQAQCPAPHLDWAGAINAV